MFNLHGGENVEDDSSDEYFSSIDSDGEDDNIFNFDAFDSDDYDSDNSDLLYGDTASDDEFYQDLGDEKSDNIHFTFGDTITKALILWAVEFGISHTALTALLLILKRFGHEELPKLARTLLHTPRKAVEPRPCAPGEFFYRGIVYNTLQYDHDFLIEAETVEIDFFIDGLSLSDSSKVKMWPIMASFVNHPEIEPFVVGCYAGYGDPADVDDFMREFVDEIKQLQQNGIRVTKNKILKKFRFRCFIADAPARSFATGTLGHASYYGCPNCDQVCCGDGHKLYYQYFIGKLRTDESFRERSDIQHHKPQFQYRASYLETAIGMVSQVVIEAMHAVDLGVTKRICDAIFIAGTVCSKMVPRALAVLQERFKSFKRYVPSDFARKPRNLTELSRFKATEFRQMLLYTLPVLLKNVVSPQLYKHFLKLHVAIRLLSDSKRYRENITAARQLLKEFVEEYDDTIGKKHFTFYTHCLLHIPDYVERYGPLYSLSAYKYENHMRIIKRLLRRKHGHLKQFFNRVEEMRYARELESKDRIKNHSKFNSFNLEANSLRDGCVMVEPGYPLVITRSFDINGKTMISGYRFNQFSNFYDDPVPSMENMGIILINMERLVKNKWILPTTTNTSKHLQSGTPHLQQTVPHPDIRTPKFKHSPLVLKSDSRKMKINGHVANEKVIKHSKNIQRPSLSVSTGLHSSAHIEEKALEDHKFAVPLPRPFNAKIIKSTPVLPTNSNKREQRGNYPMINNKMSATFQSNGSRKMKVNDNLIKNSTSTPSPSLGVSSSLHSSAHIGEKESHKFSVLPAKSFKCGQPIIISKMSTNFISNAVTKKAAVDSKEKKSSRSQPQIMSTNKTATDNFTSSISIRTHNGLVPIPSNWKLKKFQPAAPLNVLQVNKTSINDVPLPHKLHLAKGTPWNLDTQTLCDKSEILRDSLTSKTGPTHSTDESSSLTITHSRKFGGLQSASPGNPFISKIMDPQLNLQSNGVTNRVPLNVLQVNKTSINDVPLPHKLHLAKGTPWNLDTQTLCDKSEILRDSLTSKTGPTHSTDESSSLTITHTREFGGLQFANPVKPFITKIMEPNLQSSAVTNRGPSTKAINVISTITIPPGYKQAQQLISQQRVSTLITDTVSTASVRENNPKLNIIYGTIKDLNKSVNLSGGSAAVCSSVQNQFSSSRGESLESLTTAAEDNEYNEDDGQSYAKKKKTSHEGNEENRKLDIILEELQQIKRREAKTNSKVNFIVRKLMDDDSEWKSFTFPMDDEAEYDRFKDCLLNKRFTDKLVTTLKNKIFMSKKIVSELVEMMFAPELLIKFNKCGLKGRDSFEKSKINEIFLAVSGMNPQLYNSDLAKVMNKMHMRYTRRYGKY